jgi:hypothetical protein
MNMWRGMSRYGLEACAMGRKARVVVQKTGAAGLMIGLLGGGAAVAQADGNNGINQATTMISGYFDTGINLLYAVGGILGLIGAVRVYSKWSHGDHDTAKVAAAWFSACIFLVVVATVIKSFFGLQ